MEVSVEVVKALETTGIPFTWAAWPEGKAPKLPWCVWLEDDRGEFYADNRNFVDSPTIRVELYQRQLDNVVTSTVRNALRTVGPTSEYSAWIESEQCMVTYFMLTKTNGSD